MKVGGIFFEFSLLNNKGEIYFVKKLILLLVIVLFLVVIIMKVNRIPSITVTSEGKKVTTVQGSYCWNGFLNSKCEDLLSPYLLVDEENIEPISINQGSKINIDFNPSPIDGKYEAYIWKDIEKTVKANMKGNILEAPTQKGSYVYEISADWKRGQVSYAFIIEVH